MNKNRLEAFSDGVLAIIITIMVLELRPPHHPEWSELISLIPTFVSYVLSFIYIGIYWNNHHHMLQIARHVNGATLWANLHLLFWISMIPFATAWAGDTHFASGPVALYGFVLLMCGFAYNILARTLVRSHPKDAPISKALGNDRKGKASVFLYALAIPTAHFFPSISCTLYIAVAALWLVPDRRIENLVIQVRREE